MRPRSTSLWRKKRDFFESGGKPKLPSTSQPLYNSLTELPLADPDDLNEKIDPVRVIRDDGNTSPRTKRALVAEKKLELLHLGVLQALLAADMKTKGDIFEMIGELVEVVNKSEIKDGTKAQLKIENERLAEKITDLELVMKFQLQSLNDMAVKEADMAKEVQAKYEEQIAHLKREQNDRIVEVNKKRDEEMAVLQKKIVDQAAEIDQLWQEKEYKTQLATAASKKPEKNLSIKPVGKGTSFISSPGSAAVQQGPSPLKSKMSTVVAPVASMPSQRTLQSQLISIGSSSSLPTPDMVTGPRVAEFIHAHRLYRILPLKRGEEPSNEPSYFELNAQGLSRNRVNLVHAPLDVMIDLLTIPEDSPLKSIWEYDVFMRSFLYVFPTFTTVHQVLSMLIDRFTRVTEYPDCFDLRVKYAIIQVFKFWINLDLGKDFLDVRDVLVKFIEKNAQGILDSPLKKLHFQLDHIRDRPEVGSIPPALLPAKPEPLLVVDISPLELARQLTLVESDLFNKVPREELLKGRWYGKTKNEEAPNLLKMISHANRITSWITTEILKFPTVATRRDAIVLFIHAAQALEQLQNYNGIIQVLSSLHSSTISKLKNSWEQVSKRDKEIFERVTALMDTSFHYKAYNEALHAIADDKPTIPLISVICSELFNVNDAMKDESSVKDTWINWDKFHVVGDRIHELKRFGRVNYALEPIEIVQKMLLEGENWNDDDICYEIAAIRDNAPDDPKLTYTSTTDLWENKELTERDWKVILTGATTIKFKPDEVVLKAGVVNKYLYRLQSGVLRVIKQIPGESAPRVVAKMNPGDVFGEISLVLRDIKGTTTAEIVADTDAELQRIEIDFVLEICRNQPQVSAGLNIFLATKLAKRLKGLGGGPKKPEPATKNGLTSSTSEQGMPDTAASEAPDESSELKSARGSEGDSTKNSARDEKKKEKAERPRSPSISKKDGSSSNPKHSSSSSSTKKKLKRTSSAEDLSKTPEADLIDDSFSKSVAHGETPSKLASLPKPRISVSVKKPANDIRGEALARPDGSDGGWSKVFFASHTVTKKVNCFTDKTMSVALTEYTIDVNQIRNPEDCIAVDVAEKGKFSFAIPSQDVIVALPSAAQRDEWMDYICNLAFPKEPPPEPTPVEVTKPIPSTPPSGTPPIPPKEHKKTAPPINAALARTQTKTKRASTVGSREDDAWSKSGISMATEQLQERDVNFNRIFRTEGQIVVRELSCVWKRKTGMRATGVLYITQEYIAFTASTFGFKTKELFAFTTINDVQYEQEKKVEKSTISIGTHSHQSLTLTQFGDPAEAYKIIRELWMQRRTSSSGSVAAKTVSNVQFKDGVSEDGADDDEEATGRMDLKPTEEDWALILKGAVIVKYKKDQPVISEDQASKQIYQVVSGRCRIEKKGIPNVLGYIGPDDGVFGQISFLEGGHATASVIADEDTTVHIIQAYFLNILFQHYPHLAGRFYHYMASVLANTISERENAANPSSAAAKQKLLPSSASEDASEVSDVSKKADIPSTVPETAEPPLSPTAKSSSSAKKHSNRKSSRRSTTILSSDVTAAAPASPSSSSKKSHHKADGADGSSSKRSKPKPSRSKSSVMTKLELDADGNIVRKDKSEDKKAQSASTDSVGHLPAPSAAAAGASSSSAATSTTPTAPSVSTPEATTDHSEKKHRSNYRKSASARYDRESVQQSLADMSAKEGLAAASTNNDAKTPTKS